LSALYHVDDNTHKPVSEMIFSSFCSGTNELHHNLIIVTFHRNNIKWRMFELLRLQYS